MTDIDPSRVREALSRHGYGFHHAVIREIRTIESRTRQPMWRDDGTEFPIEVNGFNGQVDLLLRSRRGLLVCECKRVDPVLGIWCFARSALATRIANEQDQVAHETVSYDESAGRTFVVRHESRVATSSQYHVALEIKTNEKGEAQGTSRGALEDSINQALRGVNGITNAIAGDRRLLPGKGPLTLIPVIITTARLVTCDTDLSTADIKTGRLPDSIETSEQPWLWLRRATTPGLRHHVQRRFETANLAGFNEVSNAEYQRSIGIVSTAADDGLAKFLNAAAVHVGDHW